MSAEAPAPASPGSAPRVVLFLCVENACRSVMAEAIFNAAPPPGWRAESAGVRPADRIDPRTAPMLREIGLTAPHRPPRVVTPAAMDAAEICVSMGCLDDASCPARLRHRPLRDWALPNPRGMDDAGFRRVRDALAERVRALVRELGGAP